MEQAPPGNVEPFVQIIDACGDVVSVRPDEVPALVAALEAEAEEAR